MWFCAAVVSDWQKNYSEMYLRPVNRMKQIKIYPKGNTFKWKDTFFIEEGASIHAYQSEHHQLAQSFKLHTFYLLKINPC